MNALGFDRDLCLPLDKLNSREKDVKDHAARGRATLTLPEMRAGGVVLAMGTLLARAAPARLPPDGYRRIDIDFISPVHASAMAHGQLEYYRSLERAGEVTIIKTVGNLNSFWDRVQAKGGCFDNLPVGVVISMEGADPIISPFEVEGWWESGLRVASLVHYGQGRYAAGTGTSGPITESGKELINAFEKCGMVLDVSHLCDRSFFEAFDLFSGPVLASHNNCRELVPGSRQFTDDQIKIIIERNGIVGVAFDAWMLADNWIRGKSDTSTVSIGSVVDHIDHICSLAGDAGHVAIGSDLDGGFGTEQTPGDLKTIADLQLVAKHLSDRGYTDQDIDAILHGNWLAFLRDHLPG